jgi:carboxypeptidase C (cathepsin A)
VNEAISGKMALSEVDGVVTIAGKKVEYRATADRLAVQDRTGKATANIFFVAYTRKGAGPNSTRPIAFCFNGGPGASSVWLHMGALGPRRVLVAEDGKSVPTPVKVVDNEWSLLDVTDLVFIVPVGTGFSRADDPDKASYFYGVEEDLYSIREFILLYIERYGRWRSPKYLVGESYGAARAAGLARSLQNYAPCRSAVSSSSPASSIFRHWTSTQPTIWRTRSSCPRIQPPRGTTRSSERHVRAI